MDVPERPGLGVFEMSVEGPLGPLLRCALKPRVVVHSGRCTVLRVASPADLVELVELLISADLAIDSVRPAAL
jgi:hypothetical protein